MGSMFRSEKMSLCQIFLAPEAAYNNMADLGELGCVQFRDLNNEVTAFQRRFVSEVRRCDEMERQMRYITRELEKDGIKLQDVYDDIPSAPNPRDSADLEAQLEKAEYEIREMSENDINLKSNLLELTELCKVIEKTQDFFTEQTVLNMEEHANSGTFTGERRGCLGFIAGVINRQRLFAFERMLWRISRGNILVKHADIEEPLHDPRTGNRTFKTAFVVFYQGEQLNARIKKVCTGFHASLYPCPNVHDEREDMLKGVKKRLEDLKLVLKRTDDQRNCILAGIAKHLPIWSIKITKMKAIYHTLNYFNIDVTSKCLIGECWVPTMDLELVQQTIANGSANVGSTGSFLTAVATKKSPPTYFRTNKFTRGFQNLIDAYGMATYREVNPALYTCITFPFLFAVMFGDLGHGFIMFLIGFWMVIDEERLMRKKGGEIWRIMFGGRYIILLLGLFSMYTGFTYNDTFSKSFNVFGSKWRVRYNTTTVLTNANLQLDPTVSTIGTYPWGMDPIWQLGSNKIIFYNSYKMKLSIIFGVLHMVFGVCMSVENMVYFKKYAYILLEFLPQVLFLILLFGYMGFMMFYKWVQYSPTTDYEPDTPGCAPSVLIYFINMILFKASPQLAGCKMYMFDSQAMVERVFWIVALFCIPWMLIGKPLYIQCLRSFESKKKTKEEYVEKIEIQEGDIVIEATLTDPVPHAHHENEDDEEEEPMSEIWIHQAIHTIEYVLSTISHTASYLRLWALSLAHAELSYVLWLMVMQKGLHFKGYAGAIGVYIIFLAWALLTIAIMIFMEGLSAFLHTLRLHWVEFMSKFYAGTGYAFEPFNFKMILEASDED
ncbi:LOW QUALITY PROTEIN: V-type proton ATPase 116 kDa subunit a1-like [Rhagoletis pomonella]|uniref:LOW QUALITY PROTEIN: V-type proton ATPase 116 kDa subunit a1-like n=1 Tax=Rhagoletis pomonella TaxID=28610 RepID=UPI0017813558|nr:LOW QUALITY PROTEIN: V-type proton ATPase 116 kDa subunit a1-like [Rhagoletis pomonella]